AHLRETRGTPSLAPFPVRDFPEVPELAPELWEEVVEQDDPRGLAAFGHKDPADTVVSHLLNRAFQGVAACDGDDGVAHDGDCGRSLWIPTPCHDAKGKVSIRDEAGRGSILAGDDHTARAIPLEDRGDLLHRGGLRNGGDLSPVVRREGHRSPPRLSSPRARRS